MSGISIDVCVANFDYLFPNSVGNLAAKEEARGTIRTHQILEVPVHSPAYCEGPTVAENFL